MRKPADLRRTEIIEAVLRLSVEVGPDRLGTLAVAAAVGISQPAIFRHFPTREALWVAVAEHVATRIRAAWNEAEGGSPSPTETIRRIVAAHTGLVAGEPSVLAIIFSHELRVSNPALAAVFRRLMTELTGRFIVTFGPLAARMSVAPQDAALLVLGLVQGIALRWSLSGRGFDLVAEARHLLDLQLAGLVRAQPGSCP
ncbi:TetR/AcrR family transcriptional regulator [Pinisolibacter aquiterrae]|jgi:AcrR family transcriptional regulator|uniref:TetR/AcrR family transcriptional regulator n=1 Tax=Pinisolibacter aquiterrae TaxID=2815579 RepID=UPI001C3E6375|nr:TetR/AcrR family transcriptional regulator [Pinisolibacter aquiterrae]MBV5264265.1 TetR/AcrR family transcriptional regulator [Pinisolibacter aquiterrae]MCC8236150.1 TetR/AcrR family transcriptional regulator [Pinisolibacter aquiterrae]